MSPPNIRRPLSNRQRMIFQLIESTQYSGISISDLQKQTGINQPSLKKTLQCLQSKKLIKPISRGTFIAVGFQPSKKELHDQVSMVDEEDRIRILRRHCSECMEKLGGVASGEMILDELQKSGLVSMELGLDWVLGILESMVSDGEMEMLTRSEVDEIEKRLSQQVA